MSKWGSSYANYIGLVESSVYLLHHKTLNAFGGKKHLYKKYIECAIENSDPDLLKKIRAMPKNIENKKFRALAMYLCVKHTLK